MRVLRVAESVPLWIGSGLLFAAGCLDRPFICTKSSQCVLEDGRRGVCEANQRCSVPDDTCASRRRFVELTTSDRCVGEPCGVLGGPCCAQDTCNDGYCRDRRCQCVAASLAAGEAHTCAAFGDGRVSCWGSGSSGQIGDGVSTTGALPREVLELRNVVQVTAGDAHTCALLGDKTVVCWGDNGHGQLGDGKTTNLTQPAMPVFRLTGVAQIVAGGEHTCARMANGTAFCWGSNSFGQLGIGKKQLTPAEPVAGLGGTGVLEGIEALAAAGELTCALLRDGRVACWGRNDMRQIEPGMPPGMGPRQFAFPNLVAGVTDAAEITAGPNHVCARRRDAAVLCWGQNATKPNLVSFGLAMPIAMAAGGQHTCALTADGAVQCWGSNTWRQLGDESETTRAAPAPVPGVTGAVALAAGGRHTCARLRDGSVTCWGARSHGQLGDDYPTVISRPTKVADLPGGVAEIRAGGLHTCARLRNGTVACWGHNDWGQLGDRDAPARSAPWTVPGLTGVGQIAVGDDFTCARFEGTSRIGCWGRGDAGQLGDGMRRTTAQPDQVTPVLPVNEPVIDLVSGFSHTCSVGRSGQVSCWGRNQFGVLGHEMPFISPPLLVNLNPADAVQLALGNTYSCARRASGLVSCWGTGASGEINGMARWQHSVTPSHVSGVVEAKGIASGVQHLCAIVSKGEAFCWGAGGMGQLGSSNQAPANPPARVPEVTEPAELVAAGGAFSCASTGRAIYCWGSNRTGELGDGTLVSRPRAGVVIGLSGPLLSLAAGQAHACAVTGAGEAFCWGRNVAGELGSGIPIARATPAPVRLVCRRPASP